MAKTINIRGTSELEFRIGISGPTVYQGDGDPSTVTPLSDGLKNGDLYIRTGSGNQGLFIYDSTGASWGKFTNSEDNQSFEGSVTVEGEFDTYDDIIDINNNESGGGITSGQAGISVNRGTASSVSWVFDEANDWWQPTSSQGDANSLYVPYRLTVGTNGATFNTGGATNPPIHFSGDTDTGIYSPSAGTIGFTNDGTLNWSIDSSGTIVPSGLKNIGDITNNVGSLFTTRTLHNTGSALTPSVSFFNDGDTGIYSGGSNILAFSTSGNTRFRIGDTGKLTTFSGYETLVDVDEAIPNKKYVDDEISAAVLSFPLQAPDGTAASPSYSFSNATNAGMFLNVTDLAFSNAGSTRFSIQSNGVLTVGTSGYAGLATGGDDIPNRTLVENLIAAISWKEPVTVRDDTSYANLAAAESAMNGGTVDGVSVSSGDRILYTNITGSSSDIYVIVGTPGAGATLSVVSASSGATTNVINGTYAGTSQVKDNLNVWITETPYDLVGQAFGTISSATLFTIFKAVRAFTIEGSGHDGYASTAPSGAAATITVTVNGGSIGTLVFNNGSNNLSSSTISQTAISVGDRIEFTLTTASNIQDFSVTLKGFS